MRPERTADDFVVIVVPGVKERVRNQHSISLLGLHDLLRENFAFYISLYVTLIIMKVPDE